MKKKKLKSLLKLATLFSKLWKHFRLIYQKHLCKTLRSLHTSTSKNNRVLYAKPSLKSFLQQKNYAKKWNNCTHLVTVMNLVLISSSNVKLYGDLIVATSKNVEVCSRFSGNIVEASRVVIKGSWSILLLSTVSMLPGP